jgi:NAD(P)-dependent dehydrogenase (short-subunit alcohol dehydrogenase family)
MVEMLQGKVALIMGAFSEIGDATAIAVANQGALGNSLLIRLWQPKRVNRLAASVRYLQLSSSCP